MFCKSCGKEIDNDSTFCTFCGTKQSTDLKPIAHSDTYQANHQYNKSSRPIIENEPIVNSQPNSVKHSKYDLTYQKDHDAIIVGAILLLMSLIFAVIGPFKFEDRESYGQFKAITVIASLIFRVLGTVWVVNIANRQNREIFGWGVFAFLLPSIALIIIATRKKLLLTFKLSKD